MSACVQAIDVCSVPSARTISLLERALVELGALEGDREGAQPVAA